MEIILNTNLLTDEHKQHIKPQLEKLVTDLSASLNITSLKKVIIPANFTEEIIEFQKACNKEKIGHRDTEGGTTFAKVISYDELNDFSQVIFLHESFIAALVTGEKADDVVYYIQHELGHVHDSFYTKDIFTPSLINSIESNRLQALLFEHSEIIWSEYFANRSSFSTASSKIMLSAFQNVKDNVEVVTVKSKEYIDRYRNNGDTFELINNLSQSTDLLFYYTAHSLGFLHPLKETTNDSDELEEVVVAPISNTFYLETWSRLDRGLLKLYKKYPNWNDINELDELNEAVLQCWKDLGVNIFMQGPEFIINVQ